jgi:hypothetical protein
MNVRFLEFIRAVGQLQAAPGESGCVISTAVAYAISKHLPLPSAPESAPGTYYNFTNLQSAKDLIAVFNEQVVFDVQEAVAATREFWMLRYNAAHPPAFPVIDLSIGFYDNVLGVAKWVDKDSHAFNNANKTAIFTLAAFAAQLLCAFEEASV